MSLAQRNKPCLCGSGVKFKKCCHVKIREHRQKRMQEHRELMAEFAAKQKRASGESKGS